MIKGIWLLLLILFSSQLMAISVSVGVTDSVACPGAHVQVLANATGGVGPYIYIWSGAGINDSIAGSVNILLPNTPLISTYNYCVTVTDANGDTATACVTVKVKGLSVDAGNDTFIDCGATANLHATPTGSLVGLATEWLGPDGGGATGLNFNNVYLKGVYTVTVSNNNNGVQCIAKDTLNVALPIGNRSLDFICKTSYRIGDTVTFSPCKNVVDTFVATSLWNGWDYVWQGQGHISSGTEFFTSYADVGRDTVVLTVDSGGCSLEKLHVINIICGNPSCPGFCVEGIKETPFILTTDIFPNPNNGRFTLSMEQPSKQLKIELLNIQGQVLYTEQLKDVSSFKKELNYTNVAEGMYLLKVSTENGVAVKRMVVE